MADMGNVTRELDMNVALDRQQETISIGQNDYYTHDVIMQRIVMTQ